MADPLIIGLSGVGGSGKSTLANILVTRFGFVRMAFADPLKDMLKVILRTYGYTIEQANRYVDGDLKEERCPALDGASCRMALQKLGTEWGRDQISQKLWINLLLGRLDNLAPEQDRVVVDDVRMDNEADGLLSYGWGPKAIYRVVPEGSPRRNPPRHRSEAGLMTSLITADIVHDYSLVSLEAEITCKIARAFNLTPTGAWTHNG